MKRFFSDTIFNRLFGLSMAAILISHIATFILLFIFLGDHRPPPQFAVQHGSKSVSDLINGPFLGFMVSMMLQFMLLGCAAWISSRNLARPMQELASAAHQLGEQQQPVQLAETGPEEARRTAHIFNLMQLRIHRQTEERARFLAAVSHDLRTPLTRIKLRAEQLDDEQLSEKMRQDIDEMRTMLDATLDYLRGSTEAIQLLDIQSLIEAIVDNMQEEGKSIQMQGNARPIFAMPNELKRCICNVLDNAIFYGLSAKIVLLDSSKELIIRIDDQGPGIPATELENVFDPFFRLSHSRSKHSGGVGLGLSIAKEILRQHHGSLSLTNHPQGVGLIATICLPRTPHNTATT